MRKIYIKISKDKYRLPLAVADTASELARICGVKTSTVSRMIKKGKEGANTSYIVVEVEDGEFD